MSAVSRTNDSGCLVALVAWSSGQCRFPVADHPNGWCRSEVAAGCLLGDLPCRTNLSGKPTGVGQHLPPALEAWDKHVERVLGIRHNVVGQPVCRIPPIEPCL